MKVFITVSERFQKGFTPLFNKIIEIVREFSENEPYLASTDKSSKKNLSNAEVVIAEDTFESTDTGFDLATAAYLKKPILVLRMKEKNEGVRNYSSKSSRLREIELVEYTEETIGQEIKKFITKAKNIIDTKFILIISPQIDRYLQWVSDNRRMHKAQIVRKAVENLMERDSDYKGE